MREIALQIYTNFMYTREKEREIENLFTNVMFGLEIMVVEKNYLIY